MSKPEQVDDAMPATITVAWLYGKYLDIIQDVRERLSRGEGSIDHILAQIGEEFVAEQNEIALRGLMNVQWFPTRPGEDIGVMRHLIRVALEDGWTAEERALARTVVPEAQPHAEEIV